KCHDHKYDPISQKEFYQVFAYFNNVPEKGKAIKYGNSPPYIKTPTREQQKQLEALNAKLAAARQRFRNLEPEIAAAQAKWERTVDVRKPISWELRTGLVAWYDLDGNTTNSIKPGPEGRWFQEAEKTRFLDKESWFDYWRETQTR